MAGGRTWALWTPRVFWAVIATKTVVAKTWRICIVFKSACIPAPPPESEPAIERAWGNCGLVISLHRLSKVVWGLSEHRQKIAQPMPELPIIRLGAGLAKVGRP